MTPHAGRCVIRREIPPKPVALVRLQRHQFAYQDTSNSLHGVHPGALAPLPAITLPSCPHSSRSRLLQKAPGFLGALLQAELHLKARVSLDESRHCVKGSRATPESEPRGMLQDTSSCLLFLTQLLPVSPLFSMCRPGSLPCTSPSLQPCFLLVPQHKSTPAAVTTPRRCQQSSPLSSIKVRFGSEWLDREMSG